MLVLNDQATVDDFPVGPGGAQLGPVQTLVLAYLRRPTRAEPLWALNLQIVPPDDLLFLELDAYLLRRAA